MDRIEWDKRLIAWPRDQVYAYDWALWGDDHVIWGGDEQLDQLSYFDLDREYVLS